MLTYLVRRILLGCVSILGASLVIFIITRLSGDPVRLMLPVDAPASLVASTRIAMGLEKPIWEQYLIYLYNALQGDFGRSFKWNEPAIGVIMDRIPATIELALAALMVSALISIPLGVLSAVRRGGWLDTLVKMFAMLGQAMPAFWVGLMFIVVFAVQLGWLPAFGRGGLSHLIMPALALGWYPVAAMTRVLRSAMLDVLDSDYIRVARGLGISEKKLIWKYALRNAASPLMTLLGVYFASMLSGAFVIEVVFAWPGLGSAVVEAVFARDYPVVQAGVLFTSIMFVCTNLLVDLSYGLLDPRIRNGSRA